MTLPFFRRRGRSERGAALIELAVSLPFLAAVLIGTIDFARAFYMAIELTDAARAGAQFASKNDINAFSPNEIRAAALAASPRLSLVASDVTLRTVSGVEKPALCQCAANDGSTFAAAASCDSACGGSEHMISTVTVTVTKTFTRLAGFPGIPRTMSISRSATLRVSPS
jgi:Flp pilus assembly protein TadG